MIWLLEVFGWSRSYSWRPWGLRNLNSSALSVSQVPQEAPCRLSDGFLTCSGAPQAPLGGSWRLLGALGACKIKIHRPCRCLGGSQVTICRACRCLEASRNVPKSRSIVPVGVWRPPRGLRDLPNHPRPTFDPPSTHLIVGGLGPALLRSLDL